MLVKKSENKDKKTGKTYILTVREFAFKTTNSEK